MFDAAKVSNGNWQTAVAIHSGRFNNKRGYICGRLEWRRRLRELGLTKIVVKIDGECELLNISSVHEIDGEQLELL
jgi:peptidyl-tRNA hydrolase